MRRYFVAFGLFVVAVAAMLALHGRSSSARDGKRDGKRDGMEETDGGATGRVKARSKRDALRREILRHVPNRTGASPGSSSRPERGPQLEEVQNRLQGSEKLGAFLSAALEPLAADCIERAEARKPEIFGMLVIAVQTLAFEEAGAVVEVADPAVTNEIGDPRLIECMRESALTLVVPPPVTTGRVNLELTYRVVGPRWR